MRSVNKSCFARSSSNCSIRTIAHSVTAWYLFDLHRCFGNKNGHQIRLKIGKWHFRNKFESFDRKKVCIDHKKTSKDIYEIKTISRTHNIKKTFRDVSVLRAFSLKASVSPRTLVQNGTSNFSISNLF